MIDFFRYLLQLDVISENLSKSVFFEWVGHFQRKFQTKGGRPQNIRSALFGLVTKHACDRQTDGQNYDS